MENGAANSATRRQEPESDLRLDSWKQIASYLNRHMTTVRRWERCEGLPVHRHVHAKMGSIYAYSKELDEWLLKRRTSPLPIESQPVLVMPGERRNRPFVDPRIHLAPAPLPSAGLLGREAELKTFNEAWWRARENRQELIFVTGEAGMVPRATRCGLGNVTGIKALKTSGLTRKPLGTKRKST